MRMFPLRCCVCAEPLLQVPFTAVRLCPKCMRLLFSEQLSRLDRRRRCEICGIPLISEDTTCLGCRASQYFFKEHRSVFMYRETAEYLIRIYKFEPQPALSLLWAYFLRNLIRTAHADSDTNILIVPVPARRASVRNRGWDQMRLICRHLRRRYQLPSEYLLRRSGGSAQKSLNYTQRMQNLSGRITCSRTAGSIVPQVLLIDDVYTTGATVNECARVLQTAGFKGISVVTLAMAPY